MQHAIKQEEKESKGSFYIEKEASRVAEMTYSKAGDAMIIIDHTEVDDALRGTGTGEALVEAAVSWARENKKKIMPLCPFANSVFRKNPSYQDVLK
ncbi:putative GNAT family acetyltransferase [Catalinimonas alkaloidigena]|uniref:GNAT family N-acetyltransferase n=1 Tax=Catalinimonas alkaloidigena TaxID=1075417 RepID=UPI002404C85B|nr:GNAT family N-acetyltransferase [Catalinimonas alkaloidigena]MDF9796586.1 putative GNAT family acetyltransferase [Catalinimonas alkaloidigena]